MEHATSLEMFESVTRRAPRALEFAALSPEETARLIAEATGAERLAPPQGFRARWRRAARDLSAVICAASTCMATTAADPSGRPQAAIVANSSARSTSTISPRMGR